MSFYFLSAFALTYFSVKLALMVETSLDHAGPISPALAADLAVQQFWMTIGLFGMLVLLSLLWLQVSNDIDTVGNYSDAELPAGDENPPTIMDHGDDGGDHDGDHGGVNIDGVFFNEINLFDLYFEQIMNRVNIDDIADSDYCSDHERPSPEDNDDNDRVVENLRDFPILL